MDNKTKSHLAVIFLFNDSSDYSLLQKHWPLLFHHETAVMPDLINASWPIDWDSIVPDVVLFNPMDYSLHLSPKLCNVLCLFTVPFAELHTPFKWWYYKGSTNGGKQIFSGEALVCHDLITRFEEV